MLPVRLSRQMGRVKNRRNSDRIGWNSMWDNHTTPENEAKQLNEKKLVDLNVTDGSLIHCAVCLAQPPLACAIPRGSTHSPHPGAAVSTRLAYLYWHPSPAPSNVPAVR